jgi:citrate synthase
MAEFITEISSVADGTVNLRGFSLDEVMQSLDHTSAVFLTIVGRIPTEPERVVTNVVLNSLLDHGWVASTVAAARYAASGNPELVPATAAGLLACGRNTVSPGHSFAMLRHAAELRRSQSLSFDDAAAVIVQAYRADGRRLPGLGHPTHKTRDFRAEAIWQAADRVGVGGDAIEQFRAIHRAFVAATSRQLPVNVDGAMAALGCDLGWTVEQTVAMALLSVLPGILAHVMEEIDQEVPLRYIEDGHYEVPPIAKLSLSAQKGA